MWGLSLLRKLSRSRITEEAMWVAVGQIIAAIGTLLGVRLLTETIPPEVFGAVTLTLAVTALGIGTFCTPVMQGMLRNYPHCSASGTVANLRVTAFILLLKRGAWCYAVILLGWLVFWFLYQTSVILFVLLTGILVTDTVRLFESTLLGAARRQRQFALISTLEACAKPLLAAFCANVLAPSLQVVLSGYLLAATIILTFFYIFVPPEGGLIFTTGTRDSGLEKNLHAYSLPLLPLGILGWITGVGDRYVIAGMLGLETAGIYSAIYGLVSRPFLLIGNAVELMMRPIFNEAIAIQTAREAQRIFKVWVGLVAIVGMVGCLFFILCSNILVNTLLAEQYRGGVVLIPWLALGYCFLSVSYVFEKICYAHGTTHLVLFTQLAGALLSICVVWAAISLAGLMGAAAAVPIYFGLQLLSSIVAATHSTQLAKRID